MALYSSWVETVPLPHTDSVRELTAAELVDPHETPAKRSGRSPFLAGSEIIASRSSLGPLGMDEKPSAHEGVAQRLRPRSNRAKGFVESRANVLVRNLGMRVPERPHHFEKHLSKDWNCGAWPKRLLN